MDKEAQQSRGAVDRRELVFVNRLREGTLGIAGGRSSEKLLPTTLGFRVFEGKDVEL